MREHVVERLALAVVENRVERVERRADLAQRVEPAAIIASHRASEAAAPSGWAITSGAQDSAWAALGSTRRPR